MHVAICIACLANFASSLYDLFIYYVWLLFSSRAAGPAASGETDTLKWPPNLQHVLSQTSTSIWHLQAWTASGSVFGNRPQVCNVVKHTGGRRGEGNNQREGAVCSTIAL